MTDNLRDRIAAVLKAAAERRGIYRIADFDFPFLADAVIAELAIGEAARKDDDDYRALAALAGWLPGLRWCDRG